MFFKRKPKEKQPQDNPYQFLRNSIFSTTPDAIGITPDSTDQPYCTIMEMGVPEATATLVSFVDGNASLYLSTGGGIIGGFDHETVRKAAINFVTNSMEYIHLMQPTKSYPFPGEGRTRFYVLTSSGIFTYEEDEEELGNNNNELTPLFLLGHSVITELRMVSEQG